MSRAVWVSVAATLIATGLVSAIGYVVVGPKAAGLCLAVGVLIAIILGLIPRKKVIPPSLPPTNNSVTLTASPNINNSSALTVNIGDLERKPQQPQAPEPQVQKDETPSIASLKPKEVLLHESTRGVWHEASTELARARKAVVVPFKNMPKPPGEHTPRASSVTASLVFRNIDGSDELHINHGVWLGHYEYLATLNSGETEHLLVALKDTPFVTFENPNAYNPFARRFRSGMVIHHPQMIAVYTEGTVEIVLVDGRNVTLFNGAFDYKLSTEEMVLTPKKPTKGKIHFVPDTYNFGWAGSSGRTDLRAGGLFTYDGVGTLIVTSAFLKGTTLNSNMMAQILTGDGRGPVVWVNTLELPSREPVRAVLNLWLTPIKADRGKPLRGQLVLRDNYNQDHEIDAVDWPWIGGQIPKPAGT
jgi:hypothetical protein